MQCHQGVTAQPLIYGNPEFDFKYVRRPHGCLRLGFGRGMWGGGAAVGQKIMHVGVLANIFEMKARNLGEIT